MDCGILFNSNQTFLHILARRDLSSVLRSLLSVGEEGRIAYFKSRIPELEDRDLAMLLAEMDSMSAMDDEGETPLHYAARNGNVEFTELLFSRGADIDASNSEGETAWHYAAYYGNQGAVKWLIEHEAAVDAKYGKVARVLHMAARSGAVEVIQWLVEQGFDLQIRDGSG